jgi:hypothetical protein
LNSTKCFRVWKDLTLSSDADRAKYKVWDYPIKEKYSHMLETIEKNGMVNTREDGYQRVLDTLDGTFAFIDESARVKTFFILPRFHRSQILIFKKLIMTICYNNFE